MNSMRLPDNDELLKLMENRLSNLASIWRGYRDAEIAGEVARQYQAILRCMIALGFHQPLDLDSELPDRLLPQEYLDILHSS